MRRTILLVIGIAAVLPWLAVRADAPVFRLPADALELSGFGGPPVFAGSWIPGIDWREVTAYNVGVREQTSGKPCIGAAGINLCRLVRQGWKVCAANFVPLGTILRIEEFGECIVLDRMNRRYLRRVDIAMAKREVDKAQKFGLQRRIVAVK